MTRLLRSELVLPPLSTFKIEELIVKLKKDYTIVMVSNNMQQAKRIAEKTVYMFGDIIEERNTADLFGTPKKELTRNYVNGHFG